MLNQINWQLEERSDISTKWVLQNLKSEGAAPIWWWLQAWFPIQADFYQWFAFQEVILVPLVTLYNSQVARLFFFKLPPPHWLLQNSFSENKLFIERTIEHHSLESYYVYNVCQSQRKGLTPTKPIHHLVNAGDKHILMATTGTRLKARHVDTTFTATLLTCACAQSSSSEHTSCRCTKQPARLGQRIKQCSKRLVKRLSLSNIKIVSFSRAQGQDIQHFVDFPGEH